MRCKCAIKNVKTVTDKEGSFGASAPMACAESKRAASSASADGGHGRVGTSRTRRRDAGGPRRPRQTSPDGARSDGEGGAELRAVGASCAGKGE